MVATGQGAVVQVDHERLERFMLAAFRALGYPPDLAAAGAEVLTLANLRGVDSHGVANLVRVYAPRTFDGRTDPNARPRVVYETPVTARIDADFALGLSTAYQAMDLAIAKAREAGVGFVAVERSTHIGMLAAHAMRALPHDMIGLALTSTGPQVVPAGAAVAALGTNPICVAVPAGDELPFVLDMATSVVASGKISEYARKEKPLPAGWALDATGQVTTDSVAADRAHLLQPLGGPIETSGYKGSGLGFLVDIMAGILPGSGYSLTIPRPGSGGYGQFFGAWRIDAFRPAADFKAMLDAAIREIHALPRAPGCDRIHVAGEIEFETERRRRREGIPLDPVLRDLLWQLADRLGLAERLPR